MQLHTFILIKIIKRMFSDKMKMQSNNSLSYFRGLS